MKPKKATSKAPTFPTKLTVPLTKRDVFALRIACAMIGNPTTKNWWRWLLDGFTGKINTPMAAVAAVEQADALLKELDRTKYHCHL